MTYKKVMNEIKATVLWRMSWDAFFRPSMHIIEPPSSESLFLKCFSCVNLSKINFFKKKNLNDQSHRKRLMTNGGSEFF